MSCPKIAFLVLCLLSPSSTYALAECKQLATDVLPGSAVSEHREGELRGKPLECVRVASGRRAGFYAVNQMRANRFKRLYAAKLAKLRCTPGSGKSRQLQLRQLLRARRAADLACARIFESSSESSSSSISSFSSHSSSSSSAASQVSSAPGSGAIVADHRAVLDFPRIPAYWLARAKELTIHYGHTSHGSQINSGLAYLEQRLDAVKYSFARRESAASAGLPPAENPPALRMYDGQPPETYIEPNDYWSTADGQNRTSAVAATGHYNISMWSWCGQQSGNSVSAVDQYLDVLNNFEKSFPGMRFIYMTGHTDGGSSTLARNNNLVRQYVSDHGKALFDFADIESWDPAGNYYPTTSDSCAWCADWCAAHPAECQNLPSCSHSHGFNCVQKAKAFWWLMARLAGWDGVVE